MSETNQVPVIRQDAQIPITVGTAIVKRLQELAISFLADKSEADLDKLEAEAKSGKTTFDEPWMNHYWTAMLLLKGIESSAAENGLIDNMDDATATSLLDS